MKFRGAGRMSSEACMRELLAAFIARQMEIPVISPVIISISQAFVDLLQGTNSWEYANKSLGYNFGSEYIKRYSTIIPNQIFTDRQLHCAKAIFAFDVTIQNPDRTNEKPNMITDGNEIIIYDHELAFSFLMNIFPNPRPWEIQDTDLGWIKNHCLWPTIRHKPYDFEEYFSRFNNLDEDFWVTAKNLIPAEWLTDQFDKIKQHFLAICNNKDAFILELKKLML